MLIIPNQIRGGRRRTANTVPVPAGSPVLVSAVYEQSTAVTLTFAQPVTVVADSMVAVTVSDGEQGEA